MKNKRNDTETVSRKIVNPVKEDKAILYEDKTKRTRNSKTFVRNDGTAKKIISAVPLHYMNKEENELREIDNRMKDKGDFFETSYGNVKAKIHKDVSKGAKVSVSEGEFALDWEYQPKTDSAATLSVEDCEGLAIGAKAVCRDVDEATDIEYGFVGESVKENIIIKEKCDEYEYTFKINSHGLTAKLSEDKKEIGFYADESAEDVKFKIPAPFMFDSKGESSTDVHYALEEIGEGEYTFKVIADADWINRDATALPVTVDPQIISSDTGSAITHNTYRADSYSGYVLDNSSFMYAGADYYGNIYRTDIMINKTLVNDVIDDVSTIVSVKLCLCPVYYEQSTQFSFNNEVVTITETEEYIPLDITASYKSAGNSLTFRMQQDRFTTGLVAFYPTGQSYLCPYLEIEYPIPVESITLSPENMEINVGSSRRITATVYPENAENKVVNWHSSHPNIASVSSYGLVTGKSHGNATIFATSDDNSIIQASCYVSVRNVNVQSLSLSHEKVLLKKNESFTLIPTITPSNATNKTLYWETDSGNTSGYVDIDTQTGIVTASNDGVVTITIRTDDGNFSKTCVVEIDSRERVQIEKDDVNQGYFNVEFEGGKTWKSIGYDLDPTKNTTKPQVAKDRYDYNRNINFSEDELAFLYLLDPLGVEHYVKYYYSNPGCIYEDLADILFFKDRIYEKIFGEKPELFREMPTGNLQYYYYPESITNSFREDVHSSAEVLFGFHTIFDASEVASIVASVLQRIFVSLPYISGAALVVEMYQAMFLSGSISGLLGNAASEFIETYLSENIGGNIGGMFGWCNTLIGLVPTALNVIAPPNINDVTIYRKIDASNYRSNFTVNNLDMSIKEIINLCNVD